MKKIYSGLLLLLPFLSMAQPTINLGDLPTVGTTFILGTDPNYNALAPSTGPAQTWDYSTLLYPDYDTIPFIDPFSTPYQGNFITSNLSSYDAGSDSYSYYTTDVAGFYINGIANMLFELTFSPPQLFVPTPFTFGSTRNNTSGTQYDIPDVDSLGNPITIRYKTTINSFHKSNGYGSLTTPNGIYNDVLMVNITDSTYDSAFVDMGGGTFDFIPGSESISLSINVRFFTSGQTVNYIMGLELDSTGTNSIYSEFYVDHVLGVPAVAEKNNPVAFPNPASKDINFNNLNDNSKLIIYDTNGKEVFRTTATGSKNINVQSMNNGVYHYEITNSNKVHKGSFVVQH